MCATALRRPEEFGILLHAQRGNKITLSPASFHIYLDHERENCAQEYYGDLGRHHPSETVRAIIISFYVPSSYRFLWWYYHVHALIAFLFFRTLSMLDWAQRIITRIRYLTNPCDKSVCLSQPQSILPVRTWGDLHIDQAKRKRASYGFGISRTRVPLNLSFVRTIGDGGVGGYWWVPVQWKQESVQPHLRASASKFSAPLYQLNMDQTVNLRNRSRKGCDDSSRAVSTKFCLPVTSWI